ncbi:MAG: response regulator [Deltaproteobacteria bacterium]|nr:response regulator [Deltaproteobacteria bacterium]
MAYKVLIVEDSSTARAMIASCVEGIEGVEVFEAPSGFEALRLLPHHTFSLIITDINMPDINGLELVGFIKKNPTYSHIPLIIVTTEGSMKDMEKGLSLGADEYVVKPFDPSVLQGLVRRYLSRK